MRVDPVALGIFGGAAAVAVAITWGAARIVLARWRDRRPLLAGIIVALVAPLSALTLGIVRFRMDAAAHPGSDWPAMGLAGTMLIAILMPVATIPTAWLTLRRIRRGAASVRMPRDRDRVT